jgi:thioesterase domain-containing protein/acyl carrier protein
LETLPLTPNGKIDRKALPELENSSNSSHESLAPRNELEQQLADIWREVLGVTVGVQDNFFELGGHSLKAVQLVTKIRQRCQREVSLTQFFQQATIEGLVKQFTESHAMTRLNLTLMSPPASIICFPPILGYGVVFQPLSEILPEYAWYTVDFVANIPNLLDHYLHQLRTLRLERYILLGFSAGATVTLQLAYLLEQQGLHVSDVILLDSQRLAADLQVSDAEKESFVEQALQSFFTEAMGSREAVKQHIQGYAEWLLTMLETRVIKANIHYIQAVGSDSADWRDATCGHYYPRMGYGTHFEMLQPPYLAQNAQLLRQILASH